MKLSILILSTVLFFGSINANAFGDLEKLETLEITKAEIDSYLANYAKSGNEDCKTKLVLFEDTARDRKYYLRDTGSMKQLAFVNDKGDVINVIFIKKGNDYHSMVATKGVETIDINVRTYMEWRIKCHNKNGESVEVPYRNKQGF